MARLSAFKVDSNLVETGAWVSPGEEYDDMEIRTRGYTDTYYNALNARNRRAAVGFGNDVVKLPNEIRRDIQIDCLIKHCLLDVRNVVDDDGKPVDFARFCDMLRDKDYSQLVVASMTAASLVGRQVAQDKEDAAGNSAQPSA